jgi:short-chain fatty acids transporter
MSLSQGPTVEKDNALSRFVLWFSKYSVRFIPDALVFVLALTVIAYIMALVLTTRGPLELVDDWVKGFWVLLTFGMQMCVLMITGFAVADSRPVKKAIIKLVDWPKTEKSTLLVFTFISLIAWWLHWGAGMMFSLIMGRELLVRKKHMGFHAAYIAALSYSGILICNGPSQAAPLLVATPGNFLEATLGRIIPISETVFDSHVLITNLIMLITLPFILWVIKPKKENSIPLDASVAAAVTEANEVKSDDVPRDKQTVAERWDRSPVLVLLISLTGLGWVVYFIATKGIGRLDLNVVNFTFFMAGLALHRSPRNYVASVQRGISTIYGVVIQFPLYAGIFGMIQFSGLSGVIGEWFVAISTAHTLPWIIYVYSGILDMFVPSAGSKFVIEAPYIIPAAQELMAHIPRTINAYTWGSVNFNLIHPFWALPVLGAFKLRFQDVLPFTFYGKDFSKMF